MKITLEEAVRLLRACAGVIWGPDVDQFWARENDVELTGEPAHMFLSLHLPSAYTSYDFREGDNQEVDIIQSSMFLIDADGEEQQLTLVKYWDDWNIETKQ